MNSNVLFGEGLHTAGGLQAVLYSICTEEANYALFGGTLYREGLQYTVDRGKL